MSIVVYVLALLVVVYMPWLGAMEKVLNNDSSYSDSCLDESDDSDFTEDISEDLKKMSIESPIVAIKPKKIIDIRIIEAVLKNDVEQLTEFLKGDTIDLENTLYCGKTALMHAAKAGYLNCVMLLINAGARVNPLRSHKFNVAGFTIQRHDAQCLQMLIDAGLDLTFQGEGQSTYLMFAVFCDSLNCVEVILAAAQKQNILKKVISAKTVWGLTCLDICFAFSERGQVTQKSEDIGRRLLFYLSQSGSKDESEKK